MRNKENVIQWAKERGILSPDNAKNQCLKMFSEAGELADAILKNDLEKIVDGIGDTVVTLIILAEQKGLDIEGCLDYAYNEIKDRKGKTVNGTFIKESDSVIFPQTIKFLGDVANQRKDLLSVRTYNIIQQNYFYNGGNVDDESNWFRIKFLPVNDIDFKKLKRVRGMGKKSLQELKNLVECTK